MMRLESTSSRWKRAAAKLFVALMLLTLTAACATAPANPTERAIVEAYAGTYGSLPKTSTQALHFKVKDLRQQQTSCFANTPADSANPPNRANRQILNNETPDATRQSLEAILYAVASCTIDIDESTELIGCPDLSHPHVYETDYEYTWRGRSSQWRVPEFADDIIPVLHRNIFNACMASAAAQAAAQMNVATPSRFPQALLTEAWTETCGPGHRNYSEFRWRGFGGAGAASASGTDSFLLDMLVSGGADSNQAIDALMRAYEDYNISCPSVAVPASAP